MEVFEQIGRDHEQQGLSVRALAQRYRVHRRTVRQALQDAVPPLRKTPVRRAPRLDPAKPTIDQWLREDLDAPPKQRHTAQRVWQRPVDEHHMVELSYSTVRDYVARRRPQVALERDDLLAERAFVPQSHQPGLVPCVGVDIAGASCPKILAGLHPKPRLPFAALVVCAPGARLMAPAPP